MPKMRTDDGVELNYQIDDFRDPWITEPGDTILMSHGYAKSMKWWVPWVPGLSRKYTVLRYDIRGWGESEVPPDDATWSAERLATDVLNLMDHLGIEKVHWVGFESGGVWGMEFAITYPDRIKSLILCSTPFFPVEIRSASAGSETLEKVGMRQWMADSFSAGMKEMYADPRLAEWQLAEQSKTPTQVGVGVRRIVESADYIAALPRIKVPTLILVGDRNPYALLDAQVSMQKQIPNARLVVFPNISLNFQMLIPDRCLDVVLDFLEEVGA